MSVTLLGAFVAGVLTLLSPCSVMLLPSFFAYAFTSPRQLASRTGVFYLGLITTLVPIGVLAGAVGGFVNEHRTTMLTVAAWAVIGLGALMVAGFSVPLPGAGHAAGGTSTASVYALGTVYGLAGVCAGPLLGAVLAIAAVGGSPAYGGVVLLIFAAGMVVPLVLLAAIWDRLPATRRLVRPRGVRVGAWSNTWTTIVGGVMTMAIGVLLLRTEGASSLPTLLDTDQQFRVEQWATRWTRDVPDVAFAAGTVALLVIGGALRRRHERPGEDGTSEDGARCDGETERTLTEQESRR